MSSKTFEDVKLKNLMIRHFFQEEGKHTGRLVATIATSETDDGMIAIGVSRVNPLDIPRKDVGRKKSEHRLRRFIALSSMEGHESEKQKEEKKKLRRDMSRTLCAKLTKDEFMENFVKQNPFSTPAAKEIHLDEEINQALEESPPWD
jgi:hypothetical protein